MKMTKALTLAPLIAPLMLPAVAAAHTGVAAHSSSHFLAGIIHAATGLDHMLGAILGGACIAMALHKSNKSLAKALPVALLAAIAFLASAMLGSLMPASLANIAEWAVLASLVVLMAAIATGLKARGQPLALATLLVTALASCHALAHGAELASAPLATVAGFAAGACALLVVVASLSAIALKRVLARFKFAKL